MGYQSLGGVAERGDKGEWRSHAKGDGETVGFHLNALYAPLGWTSWADLAKQYEKAKRAQDRGDLEPMQVFYNTRLAKVWDSAVEQTKAEVLQARALQENYVLGTLTVGVLVLTCSVDVQANRLEVMVIGWGVGMERWVVDFQVIPGDPADQRTWDLLDGLLKARYRHTSRLSSVRLRVANESFATATAPSNIGL